MQVEANKVVTFHYSLSCDGEAIDSSRERDDPLVALVGHGMLIPGMENALLGHAVGDRFQARIEPADGYGERRPEQVQRVPKKYFRNGDRLRPGMVTSLALKEGGQRQVTVLKVGSSVIDVDLNHPLAGRTLDFDVEIVAIRDADAEEIAHGHVHGPEGHAH